MPAGFVGGKNGGFAGFDDVLRAADGVGRVDVDDLAGHQPLEEHADGGELLLHRGLGVIGLKMLDVASDPDGFDGSQVVDAADKGRSASV